MRPCNGCFLLLTTHATPRSLYAAGVAPSQAVDDMYITATTKMGKGAAVKSSGFKVEPPGVMLNDKADPSCGASELWVRLVSAPTLGVIQLQSNGGFQYKVGREGRLPAMLPAWPLGWLVVKASSRPQGFWSPRPVLSAATSSNSSNRRGLTATLVRVTSGTCCWLNNQHQLLPRVGRQQT